MYMTSLSTVLQETETFISEFFEQHFEPKYVFHNLEHTVQTVAAARTIGEGCQLGAHDMALLELATWFHDTGYATGPSVKIPARWKVLIMAKAAMIRINAISGLAM